MDNMVVITNLAMIFAMILVGFVTGRVKLLSEKASADFTSFLMNITLPCTIFSSMVKEFDSSLLKNSVIIFALGVIFFGGAMLIMRKVADLVHIPAGRRGVWALLCSISNTGFMGFPLVNAIYGADGLFLAAMMNLGFNVVTWSIGVMLVATENGGEGKTDWKKILMTNMNYAVVLGMIVFIGQIPIPTNVMTVVNYFGNITTPLSMFLIGLSLAGGRIADSFRDRDVLSSSAIRLIVMPLIAVLLMRILPFDELLRDVVVVVISMPCASACLMISQQYHGDTIMAARSIFLTSLCCIVTIPLVMMLI